MWGVGLAVYLAVRLPLLAVPLERDEGLYAGIGRAIWRGAVPYRDLFEHKPPLAFVPYVLAAATTASTAVGLHGFLLVWNLATLVVVMALAHLLGGTAAAAWSGFAFAVASAAPAVQGWSATTELLLLLPLTGSIVVGVGALARGAGVGRMALSGALAGIAFWMKQPAVIAASVVPVLAVIEQDGWVRRVAAWLAGFLVVAGLVVGPFVLAGLGSEFWYWAFTHSWLYGQLPVPDWPARVALRARFVGEDLGPLLALSVWGVVATVGRTRRVVVGFLGTSLLSALHSKFLYLHYFALAVPAIAVGGGLGAAAIVARWAAWGRGWSVVAGVAIASVVVAVPLAARPWYWWQPDPSTVTTRLLGAQGFDAAPLVADYVRAHTRADDTIFVYGSEPEIAFLADRHDVNPFGMLYPLTWPWPRHREFQARVWAAIERERPAYIILARSPFSFVRSPAADPWFDQQMDALGARAYVREQLVVTRADGRLVFVPPPATGATIEGTALHFEVWRRRADVE